MTAPLTGRATGATTYPNVTHRVKRWWSEGWALWMCGAGTGHAIPADTVINPCQSCDGAAFGPVLYRYFDADGRTLYIGSTQNISNRAGGHRLQPWWSDVARLTVETFPTLREARAAEAAAIATEPSLHNRQHFAALLKTA